MRRQSTSTLGGSRRSRRHERRTTAKSPTVAKGPSDPEVVKILLLAGVAGAQASLGLAVVKLSGRGLGHTGGTLDKLESIPGLRTDLSPDELRSQVREIGCAVAAQTADIVPQGASPPAAAQR